MLLDFRAGNDQEEIVGGWETADGLTIRHSSLVGSIRFVVNGIDYGAFDPEMCLVDVAATLWFVLRRLAAGSSEEVLDFAESSGTIRFRRVGGSVVLSSEHANGQNTTSVHAVDLERAAVSFGKAVLREALQFRPGLRNNRHFRKWYPDEFWAA